MAGGTLLLPFPLGETGPFPLNKPLNKVTSLNLGSSLRFGGFPFNFTFPSPKLSVSRGIEEKDPSADGVWPFESPVVLLGL